MSTEQQKGRLTIIYLFLFLMLLAVVGKLFQRQVLQYSYFAAIAKEEHIIKREVPADRGKIYVQDPQLKSLYPLATNVTLFALSVVPKQITTPELVASKLQPFLPDFNGEKLLGILESKALYAPPLKRKIGEKEAEAIRKLNLDGVYLVPEKYRYYPEGEMASHLLGFVNADRIGQYGVEAYFEKLLHGKDGLLQAELDAFQRQIALGERRSLLAEEGVDIVLTIDRAIQYVVEKKLKEAIEKYGATGGSVVVLEPKTGHILALASYPDFDPNRFNESKIESFTNPVVQMLYEPGSVMKIITMAAGIDLGVVSPSTTYNDPGEVKIEDRVIKNADKKAHGKRTMTQVLEKSLNTGAIYVVQKVGRLAFYRYLKNFGLTDPTGVELAGETKHNVLPPRRWSNVDLATMSFGQGIAITPLQLICATAAIANGGKLMKPHVVDRILYPSGPVAIGPDEVRQVVSSRTAQLVSATGTAQMPAPGGYEEGASIGTFVGFGPVENPVFAMLTKIDRPTNVKFAESSAAPLFGEIAKFILQYYQVPPGR